MSHTFFTQNFHNILGQDLVCHFPEVWFCVECVVMISADNAENSILSEFIAQKLSSIYMWLGRKT